MNHIINSNLAEALGNAEKSLMTSVIFEFFARPHDFYADAHLFDGVYYADRTPEQWQRMMKWISIEQTKQYLDELIADGWFTAFNTPTKLYYRPDSEKIQRGAAL